jgi:ubiquinone/menaquinone biosynthesis C-methylase UbiE
VGFWAERVVPRLTDVVLGRDEVAAFRRRVVEHTFGELIEIGFGSGLNVPLYPPGVTKVRAVEPSELARRMAAGRIASSPVPVRFSGLDGQSLPFDTDSLDCALSTFTLCTIPDVDRALREVHRVLKAGGTFCFLEHGRSPDPGIARWQRRLTPAQRRLFAGCHLDRPIDELVGRAGFRLDRLENDEMPGPRVIRPFGYLYLGTATK